METLIQKEKQIKPLSEYKYTEIIDSIYDPTDENTENNLDQELTTLLFQKEKEANALQTLINSSEKQSYNPRIKKQIQVFKNKLEDIQSSHYIYEACKELNLYKLEGSLELENTSLEVLLERYRAYQIILQSLDESDYNPAKVDIESIMGNYHTKILEVINNTGVDKKYGFGHAEARPMSL